MAEERSTDALMAFILGAAAGAIAGLLLAPRSGEETRERLSDWMEKNREKARDFIDKERDVIHHKKEQIASAFDAAKKAYRETEHS